MRILVTGGAGFVGTNLLHLLSGHGHELTVLDNLSVGQWENLAGLQVGLLLESDILLDWELNQRAAEGRDGIAYLAERVRVPVSGANPRRDCKVDVVGTFDTPAEACKTGVQPFIVVSHSSDL